MKPFSRAFYRSPLGPLEITANDQGITSVGFANKIKKLSANDNPHITHCITQLDEYFSGTRTRFDVPVCVEGTAFRTGVWQQLQHIPYGQVRRYKDIAVSLGNDKASRAVGGACNKNPLSIIIPCHRVVGHNNALTGYAGGVDKKKWLLSHEALQSS